ncbi:MAG TPA: c-type cytochrome [Candidatus Acidoferrum sp.]|nr:c-type cytochrome [Candidatus Acidoferrum sp.]
MTSRLCGWTISLIAVTVGSSMWAAYGHGRSGQEKAEGRSRQEAKSTFENICAACHGLDGRGAERGPDIVSRRETAGKSDADLLAVVREGRPGKGMPGFAGLGETQISGLVAYLRELQGTGKQQVSGGDARRGRELFFGKGRCSECHMAAGQGGFFAADLTGFAAKKNADELRAAILRPGMGRDPRKGPVTVKLADSTVLSGMPRNEDNFSLQLQTPDGSFHLLKKSQIVSLERAATAAPTAEHGRTLAANELDDLVGFLVRTAAVSRNGEMPTNNMDDGYEE